MQTGTYNWLRVSLAYQNYNVYVDGNYSGLNYTADVTVASFIGFNTYLTNFKIKDSSLNINANKTQGFWATEGQYLGHSNVNLGKRLQVLQQYPILYLLALQYLQGLVW